jgi:cell division septal protein FtsQ
MFGRDKTRSRRRRHESTPSLWRHVFFGVGTCFFVLLLAFGLWYGTRLPSVTIASVKVEGGETIQSDTIRKVAESALNGSYLKLVPYRFTFLYPKDSVAAAVTAIPRVKSAIIDRQNKELRVTFTEYVPYALWCTAQDDTQRCYFLDETGYAFAPGPQLQGGALVRHLFEGEVVLEKKQVFGAETFSTIHAFLHRLAEELSLRVTDVFYTKDGDVKLKVNGGGELILRNGESYEVIFNNLASVLSSDEFKHIEPGNFKYIDLRFGNKIFVNEKMEPDAPTTTESVATST